MTFTKFVIRTVAALLATLCLGTLAFAGETPLHVQGGPLVQKGAHLARLGDCMGCHTYKESEPYAGNKPMKSPFGIFYTANLTQDKQTGIGDWTYQEFKNSLHQGVMKDGNYIYPAMPFVSYTKISDADVKALWAYFKTIKPIHNKVRAPKLIVLDNHFSDEARLAMFAWRVPFFQAGRYKPDPTKSAEYNRGGYYVHAFEHCSSCHTPRNLAFAQERDKMLTGAVLNGWYAPHIGPGPDSAIADLSVNQLATLLKKGDIDKKLTLVGPMDEVWHDSLRDLPYSDLHAIAYYLKNKPPAPSGNDPIKPMPISAAQQQLGHEVYAQHCSTCHRSDGQGTYGVAPQLDGNDLVDAAQGNSVVMAILQGFDPRNVWGVMPSFAHALNNKQIVAVANYVRTAWHNHAPADVTTDMVQDSRSEAADDIPPHAIRAAAHCPSLPAEVIRPALAFSSQSLLKSYGNAGQIKQFASRYASSAKNSSPGQTIKALTEAYCRALADKKPDESSITRDNNVFNFAQQVATAVGG